MDRELLSVPQSLDHSVDILSCIPVEMSAPLFGVYDHSNGVVGAGVLVAALNRVFRAPVPGRCGIDDLVVKVVNQ